MPGVKHWSRPPTRIYNYNYDYGQGYYKPMVDHLDRKDRGVKEAPPGAKTFAERVAEYCPGCQGSHVPGEPHFTPKPRHTSPERVRSRPRHISPPPTLSPSKPYPSDESPFPRFRRMSDPDLSPLDGGDRRPRLKVKLPPFPEMDDLKTPDWFYDEPFGRKSLKSPRTTGLDDDRSPDWLKEGILPRSRRPLTSGIMDEYDDPFFHRYEPKGSKASPLRHLDFDRAMKEFGADNLLEKSGVKFSDTFSRKSNLADLQSESQYNASGSSSTLRMKKKQVKYSVE